MAPSQDNAKRGLPPAKIVLLGLFVGLVLAELIYWLPQDLHGTGIDIWCYSDWLIDYSTGFIRRGLAGQFVWWLSGFVSPTVAVTVLMWGTFCAIAVGYLRLIGRSLERLNAVVLLGLLFLPSLLPFYLYDERGLLGRKELQGFLIILWHLYLLERTRQGSATSYLKRVAPLYLVVLPVHLFIHEASLFQFIPAHLLISYSVLRQDSSVGLQRRILSVVLLGLPVFLGSAVIGRFGAPTYERVASIYRHWDSVGAWPPESLKTLGKDSKSTLPGALSTLFWTPSQAAAVTRATPSKSYVYWGAIFSIMGSFTAWLGCTATSALERVRPMRGLDTAALVNPLSRRILGKYFVLPLLASLPLYVLGWDYGRWFAVTCITYIFISLSAEVWHAEVGAQGLQSAESVPVIGTGIASPSPLRFYLPIAALLFTVILMRLPCSWINGVIVFTHPVELLLRKLLHMPPAVASLGAVSFGRLVL